MGAQIRETAETEYKKAQDEINKGNENDNNNNQPSQPTEPDDPNLDPGHKNDDEIPYEPPVIKQPGTYLSDEQWEAAYGNQVEETTGKTR